MTRALPLLVLLAVAAKPTPLRALWTLSVAPRVALAPINGGVLVSARVAPLRPTVCPDEVSVEWQEGDRSARGSDCEAGELRDDVYRFERVLGPGDWTVTARVRSQGQEAVMSAEVLIQ